MKRTTPPPRKRMAFAAVLVLLAPTSGLAEVLLEDKGLYKKETWEVGKYYDDLDNPNDKPGVITSGQDPKNPSGPAVDFESRPGGEVHSRNKDEKR